MVAAAPITVPIVADTKKLVQACHDMMEENGSCDHKVGSIMSFKSCEMLAQSMMDKGAFQSSVEVLEALKDNTEVQGIITEAMSTAWDEGHDAVCSINSALFCSAHRNPYTVSP